MKCSTTAPMQAWRNQAPPQFSVLSNRKLPWKEGVLYWHLANFSDDLPVHQQIAIFKDVFSEYNHELWPLRYKSTEEIDKADHKIFFVDQVDCIKDTNTSSPFVFSDAPEVIAVQYTYAPGFEWSMCMFISDVHFFTYKQQHGSFQLGKVVLHEGLHGLGLDHTTAKGDIMEPIYSDKNDFTDDSRAGLNKIHGAVRRARMKADPAAAFLMTHTLRKRVGLFSKLKKFLRL